MNTTARASFGTLLRRFRLAAGLTQAALAARAGLSERALNDLERDPQRTPRLETITLLSEALGLTPGDRAQFLAAARPETSLAPARRDPLEAETAAADGRRPAFAPPSGGKLPTPSSPFVGRTREVAAICSQLREPGVRLLTLTGPGGIGKTRLALQVATALDSAYAAGARFVALGSLTDPALVLATIAAALDLPESAHQSELQRLAAGLGGSEILLVLDNFEQVTPAAIEIEHLLTACPTLTMLITSRAVLRLDREREFVVPPLAVPDPLNLPARAEFLANDSVALLMQRARAVLPNFTLTEMNAHPVAAICARLEGVPLAIQLAAARLKLLPPGALLARLDQQLPLLTGGPQDAPERQRTIRATLDWSYHLLSAPQQRLLRRLAVFAGGWTLEAAEGVCAGEDVERAAILDLLGQLVDQSLVMVEERDGSPRYRLLETIREYAKEKLRDSGEEAMLCDRHFNWFSRLAEEVDARTWIMMQASEANRLRAEGENFRAALAWSRREPTGETELQLAAALKSFWTGAGRINEGRHVLRDALARADPTARTQARGRALIVAAGLAAVQTDPAGARQLAEEAIAIFGEVGDELNLARAMVLVARMRHWASVSADFSAEREESLRICRQQGSPQAFAETLWLWTDITMDQGDYATARRYLEECFAVCQQLDDPFLRSLSLISLARVACAEGDFVRARQLAEDGLSLRQNSPAWFIAIGMTSLGEVERCAGNDERAATLFTDALARFQNQDDQAGIAWSLHNLGHIARRAGDLPRARALFVNALAIRHQHGYMNGVATELASLAGVSCLAGAYERAARLFGVAEALLENNRSVLAPADALVYTQDFAELRANMQTSALEEAWAAGRAESVEQGVAEALAIATP